MNFTNLLTIVGGALLTVAPQIITALPPQYKDLATAGIALVVSFYHLYQPSPGMTK